MINIKPARRYAFRVGMQVAELQKGGRDDDAKRVTVAYSAFLAQFDDEEYDVTKRWLHNEYELGLEGALPLSGLLTESVRRPSVMESFTARPLSLDSVETRSTACAKAWLSTSMILSLPCGITRS